MADTTIHSYCKYCRQWFLSPVTKKKINETAIRKCQLTKKRINSKTSSCRWFNPSSVYCTKNNYSIKIINCLNRRRNENQTPDWEYCGKCRQFNKEIQHIAEHYWLNGHPIEIKKTNMPTTIPDETNKRKIKRRGKPTPVAVIKKSIKRRKKPETIKPKRKIKRRKT